MFRWPVTTDASSVACRALLIHSSCFERIVFTQSLLYTF
jgi:hypothetical protein